MGPKGRRLVLAGLALIIMVALGAGLIIFLPKAVDEGLRSATKRTPFRLTYSQQEFGWPPELLLDEVRVRQKTSGRLVATIPRLSIGLSYESNPGRPRLLIRLEAPSGTITTNGETSWSEDQIKGFVKNALQNFRRVGISWKAGKVALEGPAGQRLEVEALQGTALAQGLDSFLITVGGTIDRVEGADLGVLGPFSLSLKILRYRDRTVVEHLWSGKELRIERSGRVVKEAGEPWTVKTRVPWLIVFPLGETGPQTTMEPDSPKLRAVWQTEWPFRLVSYKRPE